MKGGEGDDEREDEIKQEDGEWEEAEEEEEDDKGEEKPMHVFTLRTASAPSPAGHAVLIDPRPANSGGAVAPTPLRDPSTSTPLSRDRRCDGFPREGG